MAVWCGEHCELITCLVGNEESGHWRAVTVDRAYGDEFGVDIESIPGPCVGECVVHSGVVAAVYPGNPRALNHSTRIAAAFYQISVIVVALFS